MSMEGGKSINALLHKSVVPNLTIGTCDAASTKLWVTAMRIRHPGTSFHSISCRFLEQSFLLRMMAAASILSKRTLVNVLGTNL